VFLSEIGGEGFGERGLKKKRDKSFILFFLREIFHTFKKVDL